MQSGKLTVDTSTRQVFLGDQEVRVTDTEFDMLVALMQRKGQVVERQWLLENVVSGNDLHMVDIHIKWIREKIELDISGQKYITTVRGVGYRFDG